MAKRMMVTIDSPLCPTCGGQGSKQNAGQQGPCLTCHGAGRTPIEVDVPEYTTCEACQGAGRILIEDTEATKKDKNEQKPADITP